MIIIHIMDSNDFIGKKFGRLIVINIVNGFIEYGIPRIAYLCRCDCKTELTITRHRLQNNKGPKSCGCLNQENRSRLGLSKRKLPPHLASGKILYKKAYADGNLSFEDFCAISQNNCHYCNKPPSNSHNKYLHRDKWGKNSQFAKDNGTFTYNGLDRIDSSKPHNLNNVVPCCFQCNFAKSNHNIENFREWVCKVYEFWANKKAEPFDPAS
jgi:hypothetical protein